MKNSLPTFEEAFINEIKPLIHKINNNTSTNKEDELKNMHLVKEWKQSGFLDDSPSYEHSLMLAKALDDTANELLKYKITPPAGTFIFIEVITLPIVKKIIDVTKRTVNVNSVIMKVREAIEMMPLDKNITKERADAISYEFINSFVKTYLQTYYFSTPESRAVKKSETIPDGAYDIEVFAVKKCDQYESGFEAFIGFKSKNGNFNFIQVPFTDKTFKG